MLLLAALPIALAACGPARPNSPAGVEFLAQGEIPSDALDRTDPVDPRRERPLEPIGALGSALAYTGVDDRYVALCDAGPSDVADGFAARFHTLAIRAGPQSHTLAIVLQATTWLADRPGPQGAVYNGALDRPRLDDDARATSLDTEGARVSRQGTLFTSDEYGPWIDEWTAAGVHLRRLEVPARFRVQRRSRDAEDELPPRNRVGRVRGRGFEGLALCPDGARLTAALQGPLLQDGALNGKGKRVGVNVRFLVLDLSGGAAREFVYGLDDPEHSVSEVLAASGSTLLVLERDGESGRKARCKRIYQVELPPAGGASDVSASEVSASDVSAIGALPGRGLPEGVVPLAKTLFLDFLDPRFGLAGKELPEKLEGLAFGPDLQDGRHLLLVSSDNDFPAQEPSRFFAFAVEAAAIPGFQAPEFDVPWVH